MLRLTAQHPALHRNPVRRGLAADPEDWPWSSYRHYLTGDERAVEIESQWTAGKRQRMGIVPLLISPSPSPPYPCHPERASAREGPLHRHISP